MLREEEIVRRDREMEKNSAVKIGGNRQKNNRPNELFVHVPICEIGLKRMANKCSFFG